MRPEAIAQAVAESTGLALRPDCCSITVTAATGDRAALVKLASQYAQLPDQEVSRELNALPKRLNCLFTSDAAEGIARKFESAGATVILRPGWKE